jgi:hypothetical protein
MTRPAEREQNSQGNMLKRHQHGILEIGSVRFSISKFEVLSLGRRQSWWRMTRCCDDEQRDALERNRTSSEHRNTLKTITIKF